MNTINGKEIQNYYREELKTKIASISSSLKLVVFQVGNNSASDIYVSNKKKLCEDLGIVCEVKKYSEIDENSLINEINNCNNDKSVTGILVQLPLPNNIDENKVIESIDPLKDVDGLTSYNAGKLSLGYKSIVPCTALGVMKMLEYKQVELEGKNVVIVGRSKLVGIPLVPLFLKKNATVTICHSKTSNLRDITSKADILVVAVGKKELIDSSFIKDNSIVIDVGINREDGRIYGDCNFSSLKPKAKLITPVPGGVGLMTVIMLINNLIEAYYMQN